MNEETLENVVKKLHEFNFGEGGLIRFASDGSDYNFRKLKDGMHKFGPDPKLCALCGSCKGKEFTRITHGTHTFDFLDAHGVDHAAVADWSQKPVLFVMENPGAVDDSSDLLLDCGRYISKYWYWVMQQYNAPNDAFIYPQYFIQKEYGWMIYSVIRTFKMANAYVTNMVKCGMVSEEEKSKKNYLTTDEYPQDVVDRCIAERLKKELDRLREGHNDEVIVFAFGERTYYRLKKALKDENISLQLLPHPANRLANDSRKYLLLGKILRALLQNHFYDGATEKPDFEAILAADKDKESEESREDFCKVTLQDILNKDEKISNKKLKKQKSYTTDDSICYQFSYLKDPQGVVSDEPEALVLRQRISANHTIEAKEYAFQVSWVEYNFRTKEIRLFAGEGGTANIFIENKDDNVTGKFPILRIITEFAEAYQAKYEPSTPTAD